MFSTLHLCTRLHISPVKACYRCHCLTIPLDKDPRMAVYSIHLFTNTSDSIDASSRNSGNGVCAIYCCSCLIFERCHSHYKQPNIPSQYCSLIKPYSGKPARPCCIWEGDARATSDPQCDDTVTHGECIEIDEFNLTTSVQCFCPYSSF